jgi:hypothetical protein
MQTPVSKCLLRLVAQGNEGVSVPALPVQISYIGAACSLAREISTGMLRRYNLIGKERKLVYVVYFNVCTLFVYVRLLL